MQGLTADLWNEPTRRRLVGLCAALSGDRGAAEDLAQETLVQAWRIRHRLEDPAGGDRWLAAIARNVCQRAARRRGRDAALRARVNGQPAVAEDPLDLLAELDCEATEVVNHALGLLPAETSHLLVERLVHRSSCAEIAARLGISDDAVSMRLTRGKAALRRLLATTLSEEASAVGLGASNGTWRQTRIWCDCGSSRLLFRLERPLGCVSFRCTACSPRGTSSKFSLASPSFAQLFGDLVRPSAILARAADWVLSYFAGGPGSPVACTRCGGPTVLKRWFGRLRSPAADGLFATCRACGEQVYSSLRSLALAQPDVRAFRRQHARLRALDEQDVDFGGVPAVVVRHESRLGSSGADVVLARDTLRVLHVATA